MSSPSFTLLLLSVLIALVAAVNASPSPPMPGFRPPAVPLIVHDPYFSVWLPSDNLYDGWANLWDGTIKAFSAMAWIDGSAYRLMGAPGGSNLAQNTLPQVGPAVVMPTNTYFSFAGQGVAINITFTSPILPGNPELLSRPATYVTFSVAATDGEEHQVVLYHDNTAEITVNTVDEVVTWSRLNSGSNLVVMSMGTQAQPILGRSGDAIGIDWGYILIAVPQDDSLLTSQRDSVSARQSLLDGQPLPPDDNSLPKPRACQDNWPVTALTWNLGSVGANPVLKHLIVAYDDVYSIQWFGTNLQPVWRNIYSNSIDMLNAAENEYQQLLMATSQFDDEVVANLTRIAGSEYAAVGALAYRQMMGGLKPVWDPSRNHRTYFLKEISSDGNLNTVDVLFPAFPGIMYFDPSILKDLLYPIFAYASNEVPSNYNSPWAPHHVGEYPIGYSIGQEDMPLEESGNILLMVSALYESDGDSSWFYPHYWPLLQGWADYLVENLPYPGNQLCTDDFEGPSPNNSNLAVKGILGISTFARLVDSLTGDQSKSQYYLSIASNYSQVWQDQSYTNDGGIEHYKLQYGEDSSWSLKYNLLPQTALRLTGSDAPFPSTVFTRESTYYKSVQQPFGLPLDDRFTFSKLDWEFWTLAAIGDSDLTSTTVKNIYQWAHQTSSRVPLTDWYDSISGVQKGFQARPVVGGVFSLAFLDKFNSAS